MMYSCMFSHKIIQKLPSAQTLTHLQAEFLADLTVEREVFERLANVRLQFTDTARGQRHAAVVVLSNNNNNNKV